jgi:hypothetical protein
MLLSINQIDMITQQEFIEKASQIHSYKSVSGVEYANVTVNGGKLTGTRQSTGKPFEISLSKLYLGYKTLTENGQKITTSALKPFVDRVQSPSLGLLDAMGLL